MLFDAPITAKNRNDAWDVTHERVKKAVAICNEFGIPLSAVGAILDVNQRELEAAAATSGQAGFEDRYNKIEQIRQLRMKREPKKWKESQVGASPLGLPIMMDPHHDLMHMSDKALDEELARVESLPSVVP